jgi:hypothetical protein
MQDISLPLFEGKIERFSESGISLDDSVVVLEKEWAVTSPELDRPVLLTHGVGYSKEACTGFYLHDPENKVAGFGHILLTENDRFHERFQDVLRDVTQAGGKKLIFDYIGYEIVGASFKGVKKSEEQLAKDGRLIRPVHQIPLWGVALDTRDGARYSVMNVDIDVPDRQRPYGFQRFTPQGKKGYIEWSRAYPIEFPVEVKS